MNKQLDYYVHLGHTPNPLHRGRLARFVFVFAVVISLGIFAVLPVYSAAGDQQFAQLGECKLESGAVIKDCKIGYRAVGQLKSDKSNVVVALPYEPADSGAFVQQMLQSFRLIDTSKYYVVVIDPLTGGISSSPSNSKAQPGDKFPKFTVKDMVAIQRRVLVEALGFQHVYAIYGGVEGGLEAFQWLVSYPQFMDKVIITQGTPKMTTSDLVHIDVATRLLESKPSTPREKELVELGFAALWTQAGYSPEWINTHVLPKEANTVLDAWLTGTKLYHTGTSIANDGFGVAVSRAGQPGYLQGLWGFYRQGRPSREGKSLCPRSRRRLLY